MTQGEFLAADITGAATATITVDNNPAPSMITLGGGRVNKLLTAPDGRLFIYDADTAIYLQLDRTTGLIKYYSIVLCTQDATAFAALVAG